MMGQEDVKTDFFAFGGGLNLVQPALSVAQGMLLDVQNYEPSIDGGYTRTGGYERLDGRAAPSSAVYSGVAATLTQTPAVGATVTCGGQSGLFVKLATGGFILVSATGLFPNSTGIFVGGTQVGTTASTALLTLASDTQTDAQNLLDAGNVLRNLIGAVPGSGPVRGVWMINDVVYAWRDNAGATACAIYKSSSTGWTAVPLFYDLPFTLGQNALASIAEGVTLYGATSGAQATLKRLVRESGTHSSNNSVGRFIVSPISGTFAPGELIKTGSVSGTTVATGTTAAAQITIPAGGTYQFVRNNFTGKTGTIRTYGVSGVGRAFEFDGTVYVPINTGSTVDTPQFIAAVNNYLYLSLNSSLLNSSLGNPYGFQVAEGAVETACGDMITGLQQMRGSALGIFTRNSTQQLIGASSNTFVKSYVSVDAGAVPYTVQQIGDTFSLDDRGVTHLSATLNFGNFELATVSRLVQPLIDAIRGKVVTSCIVRQKDQYRIYTSDGTVLVMHQSASASDPGEADGPSGKSFTKLKYPIVPSCVASLESVGGVERLFMGDSNGYVYEINKGSSFDGAAIEAYARVYYINNRSPRVRKRYRKAVIEMSAVSYAAFRVTAEFSYGDGNINLTGEDTSATGAGGLWDFSNWDGFYWDGGQYITQPSVRIDGTGINMSLLFYTNSALDLGHTLQGAIIHFSPRRLER